MLGEQVKHHIEEEETKIFPRLRHAGIDFELLARDMKEMKRLLEEEAEFPHLIILRPEPAYVR